MTEIQNKLFALQDLSYRDFHSSLMPTISPQRIIGVRTPALRKLAKELYQTQHMEAFLSDLPHQYYEENNLHALLIAQQTNYTAAMAQTQQFLPHIDNWATCDMFSPPVFQKHLTELLFEIRQWILSQHVYTVRFAIGMLMRYFLEERFSPEFPRMVSAVQTQEYYINMMIAWYYATALAKQYDAVLPYLMARRLPQWVHNKTIQKALESKRVSAEHQAFLKTLRWK